MNDRGDQVGVEGVCVRCLGKRAIGKRKRKRKRKREREKEKEKEKEKKRKVDVRWFWGVSCSFRVWNVRGECGEGFVLYEKVCMAVRVVM